MQVSEESINATNIATTSLNFYYPMKTKFFTNLFSRQGKDAIMAAIISAAFEFNDNEPTSLLSAI